MVLVELIRKNGISMLKFNRVVCSFTAVVWETPTSLQIDRNAKNFAEKVRLFFLYQLPLRFKLVIIIFIGQRERAGFCQSFIANPLSSLQNANLCGADDECPEGLKCCQSDHGYACVNAGLMFRLLYS